MKKRLVTVIVPTLLLAVVGCGGDSDAGADPAKNSAAASPSDAPRSDAVVNIALEGGKVTPQGGRVHVKVGQKIVLHITSDAEDEIHVHSQPQHVYKVGPGDEINKTFTINTPGRVTIEAHHLGKQIRQLDVRP